MQTGSNYQILCLLATFTASCHHLASLSLRRPGVSAKLNLLNILQKSISIMAPLTHRVVVLRDYVFFEAMDFVGGKGEVKLSVCVWFAAGTHPQSSVPSLQWMNWTMMAFTQRDDGQAKRFGVWKSTLRHDVIWALTRHLFRLDDNGWTGWDGIPVWWKRIPSRGPRSGPVFCRYDMSGDKLN